MTVVEYMIGSERGKITCVTGKVQRTLSKLGSVVILSAKPVR